MKSQTLALITLVVLIAATACQKNKPTSTPAATPTPPASPLNTPTPTLPISPLAAPRSPSSESFTDEFVIMNPGDSPDNYVALGCWTESDCTSWELRYDQELRSGNQVVWSNTVQTGLPPTSTLGSGVFAETTLSWPSSVIGQRWQRDYWHAINLSAFQWYTQTHGNQYVCGNLDLCIITLDENGEELPTDARGFSPTGQSGTLTFLPIVSKEE